MYELMSADEAIRLIRDGDCICVNSFVGIESPVELHEAIYRKVRETIPTYEIDREIRPDISEAERIVKSGILLELAGEV